MAGAPRYPATKRSAGRSYSSRGVPTWWTYPWCMTATWSASVSASFTSDVAKMDVRSRSVCHWVVTDRT